MNPDDLVERVVYGWTPLEVRVHEAIYRDGRGHDVPRYLIRAAIAVALEEAAKVLSAGDDGHDWSPDGAAAAIRAMIPKENK